MYDLLRRMNEGLRSGLLRFVRELIQTPSLSFQEAAVANQVQAQMDRIGFDKVLRDEAGNVLGVLFGSGDRTLLLNSHMDTVAAGPEELWRHPPTSGVVEEGRIHGRGAADCKAGVAAQVFAGALLKRSLLPLEGNIVVAATVAEETGGSIGVRALLEKTLPELKMTPTFAVLGEPTGLDVYHGHEGWLELEMRVEGTDPFEVEDTATRLVFNTFGPPGAGPSTANGSDDMVLYKPQLERAEGRTRATIPLDRRWRDGEDVEEIVGHLKGKACAVLDRAPSDDLAIDVRVREEDRKLYNGRTTPVRHLVWPWATDPFHPLIARTRDALAAAGCDAQVAKWRLDRIGMGTAGGLMVNDFGIPTIGYGPGREGMAHAPNEYVEIDKLVQAVYGTAAIAHALVGIPVYGWTSQEI